MLISGNPNYGIAKALHEIYPNATFASRASGYDLTTKQGRDKFANEAVHHDVIIINAALWQFQQTVLLDAVYKNVSVETHIIVIGSTTDRVKNGKPWLYNAEKKALRDYSNTLAIGSVWGQQPKVNYISFGTLSNNQEKHPERKCLDINEAAEWIAVLINAPKHLNINEISIDPVQ